METVPAPGRSCRPPAARRAADDAFRQVELVVNAVLGDVAGAQVLSHDQRTDARIDNHAALDRCLMDAAREQPAQVLELQQVGPG